LVESRPIWEEAETSVKPEKERSLEWIKAQPDQPALPSATVTAAVRVGDTQLAKDVDQAI